MVVPDAHAPCRRLSAHCAFGRGFLMYAAVGRIMTFNTYTHGGRRGVAPKLTPGMRFLGARERELRRGSFPLLAVRTCFLIIALASLVFAVSCANNSGSCNGDQLGVLKVRADCDAPYFLQVQGCVKDVDCASFNDATSCQAASCALSSHNFCTYGFAPCHFDPSAPLTDQAVCEETPNCRWDTLCMTTKACEDFHTQDSCAAVPYCDWEANPL